VISGASYNWKGDLFSLGGILYFMITMKEEPLYVLANEPEKIRGKLKPFEISSELEDLVLNLLSIDPNERKEIIDIVKALNGDVEKLKFHKMQFNSVIPQKQNVKVEENEKIEVKKEIVVKNVIQQEDSYDDLPIKTLSIDHSIDYSDNKKVVSQLVKLDGYELEFACKSLQNNKEIVLLAVSENGNALTFASKKLQANKEVVLKAVQNDGIALQFASKLLKKDDQIVNAAVASNGMALQFLNKKYRENEEIVKKAVESDGLALKFASPQFKSNHKIVSIAVNQNGLAYRYADRELQLNKKIAMNAFKNDPVAIKYAPSSIKKDKEIVLQIVSIDGLTLEYVHSDLKKDKDVVMAAVKENGIALDYAAKPMRDDKEIVIEAIKSVPDSLRSASERLANDRDIALAAVKADGLALLRSSKKLFDDEELILEACKSNGEIFEHLNEPFKKKEFLMEALKTYTNAIYSSNFEDDEDVVLEAVKYDGTIIMNLSDKIKSNKKIIREACKQNMESLHYASPELLMDEDFILDVMDLNVSALRYTKLNEDKSFIKKIVNTYSNAYLYISPKLQKDEDISIEFIKENPNLLAYFLEDNKSDKICIEAIQGDINALYFVSDYLKNDLQFSLKCVNIDGDALQFLSTEMKNNVEVVTAAVENKPESYIYASTYIQYLGRSSKYKEIEKLSEGGEGIIYKVEHEGNLYAEKRIYVENVQELNDLFKTFNLIQSLKSDYIYEIIEIIQDVNQITNFCLMKLVMKLYEGDLMQLISKKFPNGIPEDLLVNFAIQITKGLVYIHENQILHCDLKPENIFFETVSGQIRLRVGDFGNRSVINTEKILGSYMYVAPEIIEETSDQSIYSDMFSLGGIFYRMMFNKDDVLYMKCLKGEIQMEKNSKYSKKLENLVLELLSKDPKKRPTSTETLKMLESL
jgi:serine/threonine protein kinase